MTIRWTAIALADLQSVHVYLPDDSQDAATAPVDHLSDAIRELGKSRRWDGPAAFPERANWWFGLTSSSIG